MPIPRKRKTGKDLRLGAGYRHTALSVIFPLSGIQISRPAVITNELEHLVPGPIFFPFDPPTLVIHGTSKPIPPYSLEASMPNPL